MKGINMRPTSSRLSLLTLLLGTNTLFNGASAQVTDGTKANTEKATGTGTAAGRISVVETSVFSEIYGSPTVIETFYSTQYAQYATLKTTTDLKTVITATNGDASAIITYPYKVGPNGVGWTIPTAVNGVPVLPQPPFLPGEKPITQTSLGGGPVNPTGTDKSPTNDPTGRPTGTDQTTNPTRGGTTQNEPTGGQTSGKTGTQTGRPATDKTGTGTETGPPVTDKTGTGTKTDCTATDNTGAGTQTGRPNTHTTGTGTKTNRPATDNTATGTKTDRPATDKTGTGTGTGAGTGVGTNTNRPNTDTTGTGTKTDRPNTDRTGTGTAQTQNTEPTRGTATATGTGRDTGTKDPTSKPTSGPGGTDTKTGNGVPTGTGTNGSPTNGNTQTGSGPTGTKGNTDSVTSTVTTVPPDFTGITLSGKSYTTNDWYTTTDKDHHTTLMPLIILPGGAPIILWNLPPIPHVDFQLPGLPKFHLPCIKVFGVSVGSCDTPPKNDGPPDDKPTGSPTKTNSDPSSTNKQDTSAKTDQTSKTTGSCTATKTVSDCVVSCATTTGTQASCASYTTKCTQTNTGCSVTGTTTTVTGTDKCSFTPPSSFGKAQQTYCGTVCALTMKKNGKPASPTSAPRSSEIEARAIAGRITMNPLKKRAPTSTIASFGGCALATPASDPLFQPGWPSVYDDILKPELAGNLKADYKNIPRYDRATTVGCIFTTTRLSAAQANAPPAWNDYFGNNGGENNKWSLDHPYEKGWLKDFFNAVISSTNAPGALSCSQANQFFFPTTKGGCKVNFLQAIWDEIPSDARPDFILMSAYLNNNAKGQFFPKAGQKWDELYINDPSYKMPANAAGWVWSSTSNGQPYPAKETMEQFISYFEVVLYGVLEMKSASMLQSIDHINNAIWNAMTQLDRDIKANPGNFIQNAGDYFKVLPNGLAGAYKDYITKNVEPTIQRPPKYLTQLWKGNVQDLMVNSYNLPEIHPQSNRADPGAQGEWQTLYNFLTNMDKHYNINGAYSWEYDFHFSWDPSKVKRDSGSLLRRAGSCPIPTGSGTGTQTTGTAKATGTSQTKATDSTAKPTGNTSAGTTQAGGTKTTTAGNPPSTKTSSPTSTKAGGPPACVGNQIQGTCTQAHLPSATPNSGPQQPVCLKVQSKDYPYLRINADKARTAASTYCNNLVNSKWVLADGKAAPNPGRQADAAENGGQVVFSVLFDVASCDPGTSKENQKLDFGKMGVEKCYQYLYESLKISCSQDSTWDKYDPKYTIEGGVWAGQCAMWAMEGLPATKQVENGSILDDLLGFFGF